MFRLPQVNNPAQLPTGRLNGHIKTAIWYRKDTNTLNKREPYIICHACGMEKTIKIK